MARSRLFFFVLILILVLGLILAAATRRLVCHPTRPNPLPSALYPILRIFDFFPRRRLSRNLGPSSSGLDDQPTLWALPVGHCVCYCSATRVYLLARSCCSGGVLVSRLAGGGKLTDTARHRD
ncbi:hypothetical protein V8C44DRAFT_322953 [Trichoderma aethiopicum]